MSVRVTRPAMIIRVKPVESLTVADLEWAPVWQYTNRDGAGETVVRAVKRIPVRDISGKLIGTQVRFANGTRAWALIYNVMPENARQMEHLLTLSIEHAGKWFDLARYHDPDYTTRSPEALARFLGLAVDEIFPISFDLRPYVEGDPAVLQGSVLREPRERLSRDEIIAMALV